MFFIDFYSFWNPPVRPKNQPISNTTPAISPQTPLLLQSRTQSLQLQSAKAAFRQPSERTMRNRGPKFWASNKSLLRAHVALQEPNLEPRWLNMTSRLPKLSQHDPSDPPTWSQHGPKMLQLGSNLDPLSPLRSAKSVISITLLALFQNQSFYNTS